MGAWRASNGGFQRGGSLGWKRPPSRPEWRVEAHGGGGAKDGGGGEEKEAGEVAAMVKTISVVLVFVGVYVASIVMF